jgi:hypothetical protein
MIPIIENWSDILGQVLEVDSYPDITDFDSVEILVEHVEPVEDYPDLLTTYLTEAPEPRLSVLMPNELVSECQIEAGTIIECRVRRAGIDRVFVHREHITVRSSKDEIP